MIRTYSQLVDDVFVDEAEKQLNKVFIHKKLTIKVIIACRTIATHKFRTRLSFRQYDVTLTKQQSVLTKINCSLKAENMQTKHNMVC